MNGDQQNPQQNPQQKQVNIKATDAALQGVYANNIMLAHSREEFVLDFMNIFPPQGQLASRVIISPGHAKRLLKALEDNIKKYEKQHGNIKEAAPAGSEIGFKTN
ncbi:DUF3467 domain-containing protein [Patescibacteria group bacterium]